MPDCNQSKTSCSCTFRSGFINSNGVKIFYRLRGKISSQIPAIVFLHGFPYSGEVWDCQQKFFCCQGYTTLAIDYRGFGCSDKPTDMSGVAVLNDIHTVIQQLGITRPIIVGSSIGGFLAMLYALNFPTEISQLVVIDSFTSIVTYSTNQTLQLIGLWLSEQITYPVFAQRFTDLAISETCADPKLSKLKQNLVRIALQASPVSGSNFVTQNADADISSIIRNIRVPTFVFFGNNDNTIRPDASIFIYNNIPGAQLIGIANAGHFPFATHSTLFNRTLLESLQNKCNICKTCPRDCQTTDNKGCHKKINCNKKFICSKNFKKN